MNDDDEESISVICVGVKKSLPPEMSVAMCYLSSTASVAQPWEWAASTVAADDDDDCAKNNHHDFEDNFTNGNLCAKC